MVLVNDTAAPRCRYLMEIKIMTCVTNAPHARNNYYSHPKYSIYVYGLSQI